MVEVTHILKSNTEGEYIRLRNVWCLGTCDNVYFEDRELVCVYQSKSMFRIFELIEQQMVY